MKTAAGTQKSTVNITKKLGIKRDETKFMLQSGMLASTMFSTRITSKRSKDAEQQEANEEFKEELAREDEEISFDEEKFNNSFLQFLA